MIVKTYKVLSASWNRRGGREKERERGEKKDVAARYNCSPHFMSAVQKTAY